ncbi:hypothetical protein IFM51744_09277 [Aspergillus udagawae]|nr:hypothetical protein IFM51744_09277 [Aspergillus udagawae]
MRAFPTTAPSSRLQTARKHCLKAAYHTNSFYSPLANVAEKSSRTWLPGELLKKALMGDYSPIIRTVDLGKEAEYMTSLEPRQRICYYPGKLHGGIQAFYLDNLFADCCRGALTANLTLSYLRPVNPQAPLSFSVWPVKVEGRKTYMEGCIKIPDAKTGAMIEAVRAKALFIKPRNRSP